MGRSDAGGRSLDETLAPQVVQVVLPDGDTEVRLASLDLDSGRLNLRQVGLDSEGEVVVGGQAAVKLASIGGVSCDGRSVKLKACSAHGRVLLELHFDAVSAARNWSRCLLEASRESNAGNSTATEELGDESNTGANASLTLKALVAQQEEQVRLLEEINRKKGEQLLKMQEKLEDSLGMLQMSQQTYGQQQRTVDRQNRLIDQLKLRLQAADRGIAANGARNARVDSAAPLSVIPCGGPPVARLPVDQNALMALLAGDGGLNPLAALLGSGGASNPLAALLADAAFLEADLSGGRAASAGSQPAFVEEVTEDEDAESADEEGNAGEDEDGDDDDDPEEEQRLVEKLRNLEVEKGHFESQLRDEQNQIASQLHDLQRMMSVLGVSAVHPTGDDT